MVVFPALSRPTMITLCSERKKYGDVQKTEKSTANIPQWQMFSPSCKSRGCVTRPTSVFVSEFSRCGMQPKQRPSLWFTHKATRRLCFYCSEALEKERCLSVLRAFHIRGIIAWWLAQTKLHWILHHTLDGFFFFSFHTFSKVKSEWNGLLL